MQVGQALRSAAGSRCYRACVLPRELRSVLTQPRFIWLYLLVSTLKVPTPGPHLPPVSLTVPSIPTGAVAPVPPPPPWLLLALQY